MSVASITKPADFFNWVERYLDAADVEAELRPRVRELLDPVYDALQARTAKQQRVELPASVPDADVAAVNAQIAAAFEAINELHAYQGGILVVAAASFAAEVARLEARKGPRAVS